MAKKSPKAPRCVDCRKEGVTTVRPTPFGGPRSPRCVTHERARRKRTRLLAAQSRVRVTYEMPPAVYDKLYVGQGGLCPICRIAKGIAKRLSVDHDHKICDDHPPDRGCPRCWRGLLCSNCNVLIGRYDTDKLQRAIDYLRNPPAQRILREMFD